MLKIQKDSSSFVFYNIVQFLDAFNENLFKLLLAYFLIFYQGLEKTPFIMSATGFVFMLPFILFSSLGGMLADRWSKTWVIRLTRIVQVAVMGLAFVSFSMKATTMAYIVLFISASISAIFGPAKYGIILELVDKRKFLSANSAVAAFTYLGVIIGTALASLLDSRFFPSFPLMLVASISVTLAGAVLSFYIPYVKPAAINKPWHIFIYSELYTSLKEMGKEKGLLFAVLSYSYFLFIGAYAQMNIISYSVEVLHMGPFVGGYLLLVAALGLILGAYLTSKLSGKLALIPKANFGISFGLILFALFPIPYFLPIAYLFILGIFAGIFLVVAQAQLLARSPATDRGRNFGTANFLSFVFALIAAVVLYLLNTMLGLKPDQSFGVIGLFNLAISFIMVRFCHGIA